MRVLVLTPYLYGTAGGPRSSIELWERVLLDAGIHLDYVAFETERLHAVVYRPGRYASKALALAQAYASFTARIPDAAEYDAVLVYREAALIGPAVFERWLARRGTPLIYQLDDPLYVPYRSPTNGWLSYLKFFGKVKTLCRISRTVIVNSRSHLAFASRYNRNIFQVPSVVDAELYTGWSPSAASRSGGVCVGWTGSASTAGNLELIRQPLSVLADRDDVSLRFIGAPDTTLPDVPHATIPWRAATEIEDLRRLDVGLVPVPLTPWAPHKFYLKLVQYMALGIPAVATPLGDNAVVIDEGRTGFLASNERDWNGTLARLVADAELRERVGRQAAEEARKRYTLQANAEKIVAAFRSALA